MNKILALTIAVCAILFAGCGSTQIAIEEHSPIAIFSITGNSQVPWVADDPDNPDEADPDGFLTSMVNKMIDGQNPEIVTAIDRLDYADDSIRQILPEMTGCTILEKDKVISSTAYKNLNESYFNALSASKKATGYKDLMTIGSKPARITMNEIGAKSALIFDFTFQKKPLKENRGNREFAGLVTMKAKLLNKQGKEIINKTYEVLCPERMKISNHKYDKDAFILTLNAGIDDAIRQFAMEFASNSVSIQEDESVKGSAIALPAPRTNSSKEEATEATNSNEELSTENSTSAESSLQENEASSVQ